MKEWGPVAIAFVLGLMAQPAFWICMAILAAGGSVSSAISNAAEAIGYKADDILEEIAPAPRRVPSEPDMD